MSILGKLSKYIVAPIYCEWLKIEELCLLDTAFCNSTERVQFLQLIGNEHVKLAELDGKIVQIKWCVSRNLAVASLKFHKVTNVAWITESVLTLFKHLKTLEIEAGNRFLCPVTFCQLIKHSVNLTDIKLDAYHLLITSTLQNLDASKLRSIHFAGNEKVTCKVSPHDWDAFAGRCTSLESLALHNLSSMGEAALNTFASNCERTLIHFELTSRRLFMEKPINRIFALPNLTSVNLDYDSYGKIISLEGLCNNNSLKLRELTLSCKVEFKTTELLQVINNNTPTLQKLHFLRHSNDYSDVRIAACASPDELSKAISNCHEITSLKLNLDDIKHIHELMLITNNCPHLTELFIKRIEDFNADSVAVISSRCHKLKKLEVESVLFDAAWARDVLLCAHLTGYAKVKLTHKLPSPSEKGAAREQFSEFDQYFLPELLEVCPSVKVHDLKLSVVRTVSFDGAGIVVDD